jgi:hypothetical protein
MKKFLLIQDRSDLISFRGFREKHDEGLLFAFTREEYQEIINFIFQSTNLLNNVFDNYFISKISNDFVHYIFTFL